MPPAMTCRLNRDGATHRSASPDRDIAAAARDKREVKRDRRGLWLAAREEQAATGEDSRRAADIAHLVPQDMVDSLSPQLVHRLRQVARLPCRRDSVGLGGSGVPVDLGDPD